MNGASAELVKMEADAKATAARQVAGMLKRPDQLEKVDQFRRRAARKKSAVEAMLKTAVQSQLDGVRTGLNQLQNAIKDIQDINKNLQEVDKSYQDISSLHDKLKKLQTENSKHTQLAAAVENLKHIFNVPETVNKTEDYISEGKLLHAHKCLTDLEQSRDDLLYELHRQQQQSPTDRNIVNNYFADVERLSEMLAKQLWLILQRTIITVRREPTVIVTVLRIVEREERMDDQCKKRKARSGFMPPGRPKEWKMKAFAKLEEAVNVRVEGSQLEDRTVNKMWLVRHLELIRQTTIEDLRVVKTLCESTFPPHYDIVNKYVKMYHRVITNHLHEIIQQGLEGNEIVSLLTWVGAYASKDMMGHPDLKLDVQLLSPLLDNKKINELQNQYLETMRSNFKEWMMNSIRSDIKDWYRDVQPEADDKAFYNTSLPIILFQMIEQNLQVASTINESLVHNVLHMSMDEIKNFTSVYKEEISNYREEHLRDRNQPQYFLHYLIANVNNCQGFIDFTTQIKRKYIEGAGSGRSDSRFKQIEHAFQEMAGEWCSFLLDEVFLDLQSHMSEFFTRKWFQGSPAIDTICITLEDYNQDFVHLKDRFYSVLMDKAMKKITFEYMKALFGRKITFKNYEERKNAAEKMCMEANQFSQLFNRLSSGLDATEDNAAFDAIPSLAEVIKLRDTSMMSLELSGLVNKFPDLKPEHLVNLLALRGDLNMKDAKQMVIDTLGEEELLRPRPQGIFSEIPAT